MEKLLKNIQKGNSEEVVKEVGNSALPINSLGKKGFGALHLAVQLGDEEAVAALLDRGDIDVNRRDEPLRWTPLIHFVNGAGTGDEILKLLLSRKDCDVNCSDSSGCTALHHAARLGRINCAAHLLARGADANRGDESLGTPLHTAISEGQEDMAFCLLEKAGDVNVKDAEGNTPLHLAVRSKMSNVCRGIVDSGRLHVDSCFDANGDTPLHLAASLGLHNVAQLLQEAGFDATTPNSSGHTAEEMSKLRDEEHVKEQTVRQRVKREKEERKKQHCAEDAAGTEVTRFCVRYGLSENTIQQLYQRRFRMLEDAMAVLDDKTLRRFGLSQEEREQFFAAKEKKAKEEEEERARQEEELRKLEEKRKKEGNFAAVLSVGIVFVLLYALFALYLRYK